LSLNHRRIRKLSPIKEMAQSIRWATLILQVTFLFLTGLLLELRTIFGLELAPGCCRSGAMFRGQTDNAPAGFLDVSDATNSYIGTSNSATDSIYCGKEQKRTFNLSSVDVI
jgi:hypothetical protein